MKSKELTVESKIMTEDKKVPPQSGTTETVEQSPLPLMLESAKGENSDEFKEHMEACSSLLTNIGNRQSEYLQDVIILQEDMWNYCDRIFRNQLTLFYPYLPEKSINEGYMSPFLAIVRQSIRTYLNSISISYDYALVRTKTYNQIMQASKNLLLGFYQSYRTNKGSQPGK